MKKAVKNALPAGNQSAKYFFIDKHLVNEYNKIKEFFEAYPNGHIISIKNRRAGRTLLASMLSAEEVEAIVTKTKIKKK